MPIDYTRPPKKPAGSTDPDPAAPAASPQPAASAPPATSGPSWYKPPTGEDAVAPNPAAAAPPPPVAYPPPAPGTAAAPLPPPMAAPSPPPAAAPPPPAPAISLSKITLTKQAPSISLTKSGGTGGMIKVNLNWTASSTPAKRSGFLSKLAGPPPGIDLDLACLFELADGTKGVVQALGNSFGSLDRAPYIQLDGDDRTGSATGGETMTINMAKPGVFKRVLIFAFIYDGVPNWAQANGVVTLTPTAGPSIEVRLDAESSTARTCAIAQLVAEGSEMVLHREVRYIDGGQRTLDEAYGWGMQWQKGSK